MGNDFQKNNTKLLWEELVKTALLGTERSTLSAATLQILAANGIDIDEEPAKVVLQAAAFYGQQRKVGFVLPTFSKDLPLPVSSANVAICSYKSSKHLELILKGDYDLAFSEFIHYLTWSKKQLPPESLPKLLEDYKHQTAFRKKLLPVLGERGHWLIQQNPAWAAFLPNTNIASWETGTKTERLSLLQYLRQTQPTKALQLLQQTWQEESVKDKVDFLKTLSIHISKLEEAFLENCLKDTRKTVRQTAANLLAQIENSAYVQRMYERVVACFVYKNGQLSIEPPEQLDKGMKKDALLSNIKQYEGGLKAKYLGQMMASIPPQRWEVFFNKNAVGCLELFTRSAWASTLVLALIQASLHFPKKNWTKALLQYWVKQPDLNLWNSPIVKPFIALISNELFNEIVLPYLKYHTGLLDEESAISRLLCAGQHPWSDELSTLFIHNFQTWLNNTQDYYWNTTQYKQLLRIAAYHSNPDLYQRLSLNWNFSKRIARGFQGEIEQFLRTLLFRKNMIAELRKD